MTSDLFNNSVALFPILLLTKTVSFRNRRHKWWEAFVHRPHMAAVAAGTGIALWGASKPSVTLGWLVIFFLAVAAITLAADLMVAYEEEGVDAVPPNSRIHKFLSFLHVKHRGGPANEGPPNHD